MRDFICFLSFNLYMLCFPCILVDMWNLWEQRGALSNECSELERDPIQPLSGALNSRQVGFRLAVVSRVVEFSEKFFSLVLTPQIRLSQFIHHLAWCLWFIVPQLHQLQRRRVLGRSEQELEKNVTFINVIAFEKWTNS